MDAITPLTETRFLPAVAEAITEWFPELRTENGGSRVVAVSDIDITKENIPTLPIVLVAFAQSIGEQLLRSSSDDFKITDTFIVQFWLEPERVKAGGKETPYWSYYPYEFIRNKLIAGFLNFEGPNGEHVAYRMLQVETDPLAARLTFTFIATFQWCTTDQQVIADQIISEIGFRLCTPASCIPEPECPEQDDENCDPCK